MRLRGFSLLELIIVISVMSIIMTVTSGILISLARASQKSKVITDIKNNGDSIISLLEEAVRTGKSLSINANTLSYVDQSDKQFEVGYVAPGICSNQNGYIYLIELPSGNKCNQNVRMTNDNSKDGVNVKSLTLALNNLASNPRVSVILIVDKSLGNSFITDNVETEFRTFVTSRSSIAN